MDYLIANDYSSYNEEEGTISHVRLVLYCYWV